MHTNNSILKVSWCGGKRVSGDDSLSIVHQ